MTDFTKELERILMPISIINPSLLQEMEKAILAAVERHIIGKKQRSGTTKGEP